MHEEVAVSQNQNRRRLLQILILSLASLFLLLLIWSWTKGIFESLDTVVLGEASFEEIEIQLESAPQGLQVVDTRGRVLDTIYSIKGYQRLFFEDKFVVSNAYMSEDPAQPSPSSGLDPLVQLGEVSPSTSVARSPQPERPHPISKLQNPSQKAPTLSRGENTRPAAYSDKENPAVYKNSDEVRIPLHESQAELESQTPTRSALPGFPGGQQALTAYIAQNLRYPLAAQESKIRGTVYVSFVVSKTGKIQSPNVIQSLGYGCDQEVLRLLRSMPAWEPAQYKGEVIDMSYTLSIPFKPR